MKILGHRGIVSSDKNMPYQNTIEAIIYALENGADGVEIDIWKSSDDVCYVIHDDEIEKHSDFDKGNISKLSSKDIKNLKVGRKNPHKIPTLKEVLYLFRDKYIGKTLNIEIKQKEIEEYIFREVEKTQINIKNILFSSFNHGDLTSLRSKNKEVNIGILYGDIHEKQDGFVKYIKSLISKLEPCALNPNYKCQEKKLLNLQKEKFFWTVNELEHLEMLKNYPRSNIISDDADRLSKNAK